MPAAPELTSDPNAAAFIAALTARRSEAEQAARTRYFKAGAGAAEDDLWLGVRMRDVFDLAAAFAAMPFAEIEALLESRYHEARAGAVKVMAIQASLRGATDERRRELHDLYLRRHDRINDWDLVDLGAWNVVGRDLADRPRHELDRLACSADAWERRTAILATLFFIRSGELDDTFRIAATLVRDEHDLVQKAVGGALREAGTKDRDRLRAFLDEHAAAMPRVALRYAIEHLDPTERKRYLDIPRNRP